MICQLFSALAHNWRTTRAPVPSGPKGRGKAAQRCATDRRTGAEPAQASLRPCPARGSQTAQFNPWRAMAIGGAAPGRRGVGVWDAQVEARGFPPSVVVSDWRGARRRAVKATAQREWQLRDAHGALQVRSWSPSAWSPPFLRWCAPCSSIARPFAGHSRCKARNKFYGPSELYGTVPVVCWQTVQQIDGDCCRDYEHQRGIHEYYSHIRTGPAGRLPSNERCSPRLLSL